MKKVSMLILFSLFILLAGCSHRVEEIEVSVSDEQIHQQRRERLDELEAKYGERANLNDIKDQEERTEYTSLVAYFLTYMTRPNNVTGKVNVTDNTLSVLGETVTYEVIDNEIQFSDTNNFPITLSSMQQMVKNAESQARTSNSERQSFIIRTLWMPILLIGWGIFIISDVRRAWQLTEGIMFKNVEPSEFGLFRVGFGGVVSIIIGFVLIYMIWTRP